MLLKATIKPYNSNTLQDVQIKLPDEAGELLKDYSIEIFELSRSPIEWNKMVIYLAKDDKDCFSVTFNPNTLNAFPEAFKKLVGMVIE